VRQLINLLIEGAKLSPAGFPRSRLLTLREPGFLDEGRRIEAGGRFRVRACCAANAATLATTHRQNDPDQYFPVMTMAAVPRHIDPSGSR